MRISFPGMIDLQVNGFSGVDFNNPSSSRERLQHADRQITASGVTQYLPTLITSSLENFTACARSLLGASLAGMIGIHMEGPYISPVDGPRGAHPKQHVKSATVEDFERRREASQDQIKIVTVAPEVPGVMKLIDYLVGEQIRVAIGHTAASPEQIQAAVSAGATLSTHLGNGCAMAVPRHPNFIWEQLATDELSASFIVDGHHLPPATVKAMIRAKTTSRSILITDATAAALCPPGIYLIGESDVELTADGRVAAKGAANLAGSALTMSRAVANTVKFTGLALEQVITMATTQPARYLDIDPVGSVIAEWDPEHSELDVVSVIADQNSKS